MFMITYFDYSILTGCLFHLLEKKVITFDIRLESDLRNLATNRRVVFTTIDLNEGKGYDLSTGIFTAPVSGVYVFDWTTIPQLGKYALTSLVVNDNKKSWNYCNDTVSKSYSACSKMTVVKLKQEDKVWIGVYSTLFFHNSHMPTSDPILVTTLVKRSF